MSRLSRSGQNIFPSGIDLPAALSIQQVSFDNACKTLLYVVAESRQDVDNMFEDSNRSIWKDVAAQHDLGQIMAHFYRLGLRSLEQLRRILCELLSRFRALLREGRMHATRKYLFWWQRLKTPGRAVMEDFPKHIRNLRDYNDLFGTLIRQVVSLRLEHITRSPLDRKLSYQQSAAAGLTSYGHFSCIRRASRSLYDSLSAAWTCCDHETHSVSVSLKHT